MHASEASARTRLSVDVVLLACIGLGLAAQAWLAFVTEISWDEFYFLSQIYDYHRGGLTIAPQTIHVHLLGWLTGITENEVWQVGFGRLFMLACEAATCGLIYGLSRTFFARTGSLLAVLAYVTAGFTIAHGASFRTDPLAATLAMAALVAVARAPLVLPAAAVAGACAAIAALVTAKVVFYAPAFIGAALWRAGREDKRQLAGWCVAASVSFAIALGTLYAFHLSTLPVTGNSDSHAVLGAAARKTIFDAGLLPRASEIGIGFLDAPIQVLLLLIGTGAAAVGIFQDNEQRRRNLALLWCAAPLVSLLFYRNAFAYYFAFILPPATLLVSLAFARWPALRKYVLLIAAGMTASGAMALVKRAAYPQQAQRQLVEAVHRIFPQPTPYIDRNGMIGSFPKRGFFMSTWGRQGYRRDGPVFTRILATDIVPLLIVNSPTLEHALGLRGAIRPDLALLPADQHVLRANYIQHWGPIWVAGYRTHAGARAESINVQVPGIYTVEGAAAVIDDRHVRPGDTVRLRRGEHRIRGVPAAVVTLRWGNHLHRPRQPPADGPVYRGF